MEGFGTGFQQSHTGTGAKLIKWPKNKTRNVLPDTDGPLDKVPIPGTASESEEDAKALEARLPEGRPRKRKSTDVEAEEPRFRPYRGKTQSKLKKQDDPMQSEDLAAGPNDFWIHWQKDDFTLTSHQFPSSHFINQGSLTCGVCTDDWNVPVDATHCLYNYPTNNTNTDVVTDQDILDHFDPSRLPPRIAFRMPQARAAIEKEITDLLKSQNGHRLL